MKRREFLTRVAMTAAAIATPASALAQKIPTVLHRYEEGWRRVQVQIVNGDVFNRATGGWLGRMVDGRYVPHWELP
jgi:hypothetical protein